MKGKIKTFLMLSFMGQIPLISSDGLYWHNNHKAPLLKKKETEFNSLSRPNNEPLFEDQINFFDHGIIIDDYRESENIDKYSTIKTTEQLLLDCDTAEDFLILTYGQIEQLSLEDQKFSIRIHDILQQLKDSQYFEELPKKQKKSVQTLLSEIIEKEITVFYLPKNKSLNFTEDNKYLVDYKVFDDFVNKNAVSIISPSNKVMGKLETIELTSLENITLKDIKLTALEEKAQYFSIKGTDKILKIESLYRLKLMYQSKK
jgi:hypothetical protein